LQFLFALGFILSPFLAYKLKHMNQLPKIALAIISITCLTQTIYEEVDIKEKVNNSLPTKPTFANENNFLNRYTLSAGDLDSSHFIKLIAC
jgi:hypothetical protein